MPNLTADQKATCKAIISIFESGRYSGVSAYSSVSAVKGDLGGLSVGILQTSLMSGNLYLLTKAYVDAEGKYSNDFKQYLQQLLECDTALNTNSDIKALYKTAGTDPVMQQTQDAFFDRIYYNPAVKAADKLGVTTALGMTVVFDGFIQGSFGKIRDIVNASSSFTEAGEKVWCKTYIKTRRNWLANHSNQLLHKTIYRMDELALLCNADNFNLVLPVTVRGVKISSELLNPTNTSTPEPTAAEPVRASINHTRLLRDTTPALTGDDVKEVQEKLVAAGYDLDVTSTYDEDTITAVELFQKTKGLTADGMVGNATRAALGVD